MNNWTHTTLGEVVTFQRGFDLPVGDRNHGIYPVIASTGPVGNHSSSMVKAPGVVIGRSGSIGGGQYLDTDFWPLNTTLWVKDFHRNDVKYCYYLIKTFDFDRYNFGSGVPTLNRNHISPLPVYLPSLDEQRRIGQLLGTLDDKIELNRKMNETLEEMARAIFKSWFVDFDPVKAKAEGRQPFGMDAETAALFPDSFEDSELGQIPTGWQVGSILDLARYVNGRNFTKGASGTGRVVIRIAELNSGVGNSTVFNDVEAAEDNVARNDDLLFAWSGSLGVYRWPGDDALINQHIFKVITERYPNWFAYFHLVSAMRFFRGIASDKSTTMGHIKRSHLSEAKLTLPTQSIVNAGAGTISPIWEMIRNNTQENHKLTELRDTLLPRLISGKLRIPDAEKLLDEASV